ncbi:hypothetical protein [Streptomyces fulvoviolaceus]|uniref:hypothetical protein n=1 Tax=Streptomyces fulvoviolaceus TaxID=285535 RepID=UPI0004C85EB5
MAAILGNAVTALDAVIAACGTHGARTQLPFWPLLFNNVTVLLQSVPQGSESAENRALGASPRRSA